MRSSTSGRDTHLRGSRRELGGHIETDVGAVAHDRRRRRRRRGARRRASPRTRPPRPACSGGRRPARTESRPTVHEVGQRARSMPPALGPAEAGRAVRRWRPGSRLGGRGGRRGTPVASRSSSSTARASSNRSITAWESLPRRARTPASRSAAAGPMPSARSRSVVGQRQHRARRAEQVATSLAVRWVAWTAVNRSPSTRRARPAAASACGRRRRGTARSPPAARRRGRAAARRGSAAHAATISAAAGSTARTRVDRRRRCAPSAASSRVEPPTRGAHASRVAVAEPPLHADRARRRCRRAGSRCRAASCGCRPRRPRRDQRLAHRVRVGVGRAAGVVVEVVELADARDAGQRHLARTSPRPAGGSESGVERAGERVHLLAPRPERARRRSGCARAGRGGRRGCGRWPARAA